MRFAYNGKDSWCDEDLDHGARKELSLCVYTLQIHTNVQCGAQSKDDIPRCNDIQNLRGGLRRRFKKRKPFWIQQSLSKDFLPFLIISIALWSPLGSTTWWPKWMSFVWVWFAHFPYGGQDGLKLGLTTDPDHSSILICGTGIKTKKWLISNQGKFINPLWF